MGGDLQKRVVPGRRIKVPPDLAGPLFGQKQRLGHSGQRVTEIPPFLVYTPFSRFGPPDMIGLLGQKGDFGEGGPTNPVFQSKTRFGSLLGPDGENHPKKGYRPDLDPLT